MTRAATSQDLDLLIDLIRRSPLLEELQEESLDRAELQDRLNVSKSTSHRHTRLLDELGVIEKVDGEFRLTESGALLTDAMIRFKHEATSSLRLAPVLEAIQNAPIEIDSGAFAGATVTSAEKGDPYSPVARFVELVGETETLRGFDLDAIAPIYMDEVQQRIVNGMQTEDIARPEVTRNALEGYPGKCFDACVSGNLTVQLHDDLPFALALFDHRVGIGVCEAGSSQLRVFIDTDSPEVHEWAEAVYETYESPAIPLEEFTQQCFQETMETMARLS
ncbi:helix-turn-helix transcriptional regulator [Natrialbaceae archaeon A-CW3]